jgi:hypothetical protein
MFKWLPAAFASIPLVASAEIVETPAFKLKFEGDWTRLKTSDAEQVVLRSVRLDVTATVSFQLLGGKSADTERVANKLRELRVEAEEASARELDLNLTIVEPIVVPMKGGHQVAYYGRDDKGRQFRYLGAVLPNKVVNIYVESPSKSEAGLKAVFDDLLRGLRL